MATVHFAPNSAIRYVGKESKEFSTSLARPKPVLNHGDIVIVDKRVAFNLTQKGFGEFEMVEEIIFPYNKTTTPPVEKTIDAKKGVIANAIDKLMGE